MLQNQNCLIQSSHQEHFSAPTVLNVNHNHTRGSNSSCGGRNSGRAAGWTYREGDNNGHTSGKVGERQQHTTVSNNLSVGMHNGIGGLGCWVLYPSSLHEQ